MNQKTVLTLVAVVIVLIAGLAAWNMSKPQTSSIVPASNTITNQPNQNATNPPASNIISDQLNPTNPTAPVKEFTMQSYYEIIDGQPKQKFSLNEIAAKRGDLVRIKITVTNGIHDFKIDEYNIYADTQLNQEYTVEFIADKVGEFIYYCTKPGHRANGQWGTLKVTE